MSAAAASPSLFATPFIPFVSLAAKDKESREKIIALWAPALKYTTEVEVAQLKCTSTYEGFVPAGPDVATQAEADQELLIFETYESEKALNEIHMKAAPIAEFLSTIVKQELVSRAPQIEILTPTHIGFHSRGVEREQKVRESKKAPFTLSVRMKFKDAAGVDAFLELLKPLAKYVTDNEPETLTYEAFRTSANANEIIIFERYAQEKDLTENHWKSEQFLSFAKAVGAIRESREARTYNELQQGAWGQQ